MSRRPGNPARRFADGGSLPFVGSMHSKSRSSPLLSIGLLVVVVLLKSCDLHFRWDAEFVIKCFAFLWKLLIHFLFFFLVDFRAQSFSLDIFTVVQVCGFSTNFDLFHLMLIHCRIWFK